MDSSLPSRPRSLGSLLLLLLYATAAVIVFRGYIYPTTSPVEQPSLKALVDPELFSRDFIVQESLEFSPRYYYFRLLAGLSPNLAALPWTIFLAHVFATAGLIAATLSLARAYGDERWSRALLPWWAVTSLAGCIGGVFLYTNGLVPAVLAAPFAVGGLACAARERWVAAYWLFGCAALFQFLVGFVPGLLVLPLLVAATRREGLRPATLAVLGWGAGLAAVYVPMRLSGGTASDQLGTAEFLATYAYLRHPHHVVASTWGAVGWLKFLLFQAGIVVWLWRAGEVLPMPARRLTWCALVGSAALLAVNYVGVELVPVRLVATLQLARATPFAQLLGLAALAVFAAREWRAGNRAAAALLCVAPLTRDGGALLLAAWLLVRVRRAGSALGWVLAMLLAGAALADDAGAAESRLKLVWLFGIPVALAVPLWLEQRESRKFGLPVLAACAAATLIVGLRFEAPGRWRNAWRYHVAVDAPPYTTLDGIGVLTAQVTPKNALILTPPASEIFSYKLYAARSTVVDFKHNAFSDRSIVEWQRRLDRIAGFPVTNGRDLDAAWQRRSPEELVTLAAEFGADYVLTLQTWHPRLPGEAVARCGDWVLWRMDSRPTEKKPATR